MGIEIMIGWVVLSLAALLGVLSHIVNLFNLQIAKPFKELTEAITGLRILVTQLTSNHDNMQEFMLVLDRRLTEIEKRTHGIEINCARNNHK